MKPLIIGMNRKHITLKQLRRHLSYDVDTGEFRRRTSNNNRWKVGEIAGSVHAGGYWVIRLLGREYQANMLAWFYIKGRWPKKIVDHKDRDKKNNRWANLRLASKSQNAANQDVRKNNKLGVKGVIRVGSRYKAYIWKGKQIRLGSFDNAELAAKAYQEAAVSLFGEFAA